MLLRTQDNARWRRWFFWSLVPLVGSYLWYSGSQYPHGGSLIGLVYGILGLAIVLILMVFGVRKRSYGSSFGTVESWLHAHIYLGLLVLLVVLFHSGIRFHDTIAVTALVLLAVVVLSGLLGAVLYTTVPPKLIRVESNLTAGEISDQLNRLSESMAQLASDKSPAFREIYLALVRSERPEFLAGWRLVMPKPKQQTGARSIQEYVERVESAEQADLTQLLVLSRERKDLHERLVRKQRYVNIMAVWLYLHVPLSFAMLILIAAHITAFFYYG